MRILNYIVASVHAVVVHIVQFIADFLLTRADAEMDYSMTTLGDFRHRDLFDKCSDETKRRIEKAELAFYNITLINRTTATTTDAFIFAFKVFKTAARHHETMSLIADDLALHDVFRSMFRVG